MTRTLGTKQRVMLALGLLALIVLPPAVGQTVASSTQWLFQNVTNDARNADYVDGALGWDGSAGSIQWSGTAPGAMAVSAPGADVTAWAGWTLAVNTGGAFGDELVPTMRFESAPFPQDIFVDVRRVVQVDLIVQSQDCANKGAYQFSLEARVNGEIWGGVPVGLAHLVEASPTDPVPPLGWCLVPFRFHSEAELLHQGDIITLTVFYHHASPANLAQQARIGFGPDHPSAIHIPFYPPEEAVLRRPEFGGGTPVYLGFGGLVAGWVLVPPGRRGRLVALLLLAPLLAGCSSPGPPAAAPEQTGGSQQYTIETNVDNTTTTGTIVGLVHDVQYLPVKGAHVSLRGTDLSTQTTARGQFTIGGLDPGSYNYRVDHPDHRSFEGEVVVEASAITRLEVELQHRDNRTGDQLAHRHTMWPASGSKVLFDGVLANGVVCSTWNDYLFQNNHCEIPLTLPVAAPGEDALTIYPGTQRLEVTATWNGGTVDRVGFFFTPNGVGSNLSVMWPRVSGEVTKVPVPWEMADVGHQRWTHWTMGLWIPLQGGGPLGSLPDPRVVAIEGELRVKLEIFRGVIPLEPAHVDRWDGQHSLVIMDRLQHSYRLEPPMMIPDGTRWLHIILERDRTTMGENEGLYYTAADSPRWQPGRVDREIVFEGEPASRQEVKWPLYPEEPDPAYAGRTAWEFEFRHYKGEWSAVPQVGSPEETVALADEYARSQVVYTLTVVAHRTEVPPDAAVR